MASKQRSRGPQKPKNSKNPFTEFGLLNVPSFDEKDDESDGDEGDLEAELEAVLSGKKVSKAKPRKAAQNVDLDSLVATCMKDSDGEEEDDDLSGDEDLLAELKNLVPEAERPQTPPKAEVALPTAVPTAGSVILTLEDRLKLYRDAIRAAEICKDSSKVRRYGRALKTLEQMFKSAKSGGVIDEEDIPPIVSIPKPPNPEVMADLPKKSFPVPLPASALIHDEHKPSDVTIPETKSTEQTTSSLLLNRRNQYKVAALTAKRRGDTDSALQYVRIAKKFDAVIEAEKNGQPIDLSNLPPPPPLENSGEVQKLPAKASPPANIQNEVQNASALEAAAMSAVNEAEDSAMFAAPPPPSSIKEALNQRLEKYISTKDAAQAEGNSSKVRRLQRIIKQYEVAIKDYNAGKQLDFDELPTPPGFAPIPKETSQLNLPTTSQGAKPASPNANRSKPAIPSPQAKKESPKPTQPSPPAPPERKPKLHRADTTMDRQLAFLKERQLLFRQAAISSKRNGDIQQAKEYLRMSKGFDSMIIATESGLPIDVSAIPTPPQLETDFVIIDASECVIGAEGSEEELFETLIKDLEHQVEVCLRNKDHFLRLGDVSSASKFERLGLESRKDLAVILHLRKNGAPPPRFHYETRLFSMVHCHTDLGDNDFEVSVERGINFPGKPTELDSYVKILFPIPAEAPQRAKTVTVKDTNNPIFQEEFKFEMNRKSRSQLRQFKRQNLKLEAWSKGGFLRSDTLLGTINIRLADLESKCSVHDSFDLMDGRKMCGGKLEVKIRIRDPLLVKQVEEVKEKWLVIGS